jgi:14-3-3 protein epsilon
VFWYKMAGDYRRFLSEFLLDGSELREKEMQKSLEAYVIASSIGKMYVPPSHPIRLGLALNFSVFYYEILQMRTLACRMAENSFNEVATIGRRIY